MNLMIITITQISQILTINLSYYLLMSDSGGEHPFLSEDFDFFHFQPQQSQSGFYINLKRLPIDSQESISSWQWNPKDDESEQNCFQKDDSNSPNSQARSEELTQRVNNTIFKTSLSEYRKSILDVIRMNPHLLWIKLEVGRAYRSKNLSVFPKLIILVRQLGIDAEVRNFWVKRSKQLILRKQLLLQKKDYSEKRLQELKRNISNMDLCLSEPLLEVGFQTYWGTYRQKSKFEKSKEEVFLFLQDFKSLLKKKMVQANVQKNTQLQPALSPQTEMNHYDPLEVGMPLQYLSTSELIAD